MYKLISIIRNIRLQFSGIYTYKYRVQFSNFKSELHCWVPNSINILENIFLFSKVQNLTHFFPYIYVNETEHTHTNAQRGMSGLAFAKIDKLSLERTTYAHTGCSKDLFQHCIQLLYHICWQRIEKVLQLFQF